MLTDKSKNGMRLINVTPLTPIKIHEHKAKNLYVMLRTCAKKTTGENDCLWREGKGKWGQEIPRKEEREGGSRIAFLILRQRSQVR